MKNNALGLFEFENVISGFTALDAVLKTFNVEVIKGQVVNPGKYILLVKGDYGSVYEAVSHVQLQSSAVDVKMMGNPSDAVVRALYLTNHPDMEDSLESHVSGKALGMVETSTIISAIYAADVIDKTVGAEQLSIFFSSQFGGKGLVLFRGDVAAVNAGVEAAVERLFHSGEQVKHAVMANPTPEMVVQIYRSIME